MPCRNDSDLAQFGCRTSQPWTFNPKFQPQNSQLLTTMGLKSSWLKSLGFKGLGLKLGVEKFRDEMSFNHLISFCNIPLKKLKKGMVCLFLPRHTHKIETSLGPSFKNSWL